MGVPVGAPVRPEGPPGQDAAAGAGGRGPAPRALRPARGRGWGWGDARGRNSLKFAKPGPKSLESCSSLSERLAGPTAAEGRPSSREQPGKGAPGPAPVRAAPRGPRPPGSAGTGAGSPPRAERGAPRGGRILAPLEEGALDSPGRRKGRRQRQVLGVGSPQQERRGPCSPRAAARSQPSRRRPLRSYTARPRPAATSRPPPLSRPPAGGRSGAEPAPAGSLRPRARGGGRPGAAR